MFTLNIFVSFVIVGVSCDRYHHYQHPSLIHDVDPGDPLILTPLIRAGNITGARQDAAVRLMDFRNLRSFSGYLTVNEQWQSNMFFWYFPAVEDAQNAPLIIWLEGGPGASALFGVFNENGPLQATSYQFVKPRQHSWHKKFNMIYIDNPVGSGYSYTENDAGYAGSEEDIGRDLFEAVTQLYQLFPEFVNLKLFIAGGSYAGKFVPALAYTIHKNKQRLLKEGAKPLIDFKLTGLAIANGFSDPITQINYGDNLYALGLIDENGLNVFHEEEAKIRKCIERNDMDCVLHVSNGLTTNESENSAATLFYNLTGFRNLFNFMEAEFDFGPSETMVNYVQRSAVRRSIHVGNNTFRHLNPEKAFSEKLKGDLIRSVAPWIEELLNYYQICIFHGQLDLLIPYWPTVRYLEKLKFNGSENYKTAKRDVWLVNGQVAGYVKQAGKLTEILVRNAGHLVVSDQPEWTLDLMSRFVNGVGFRG